MLSFLRKATIQKWSAGHGDLGVQKWQNIKIRYKRAGEVRRIH